jgi:hypothetical protein
MQVSFSIQKMSTIKANTDSIYQRTIEHCESIVDSICQKKKAYYEMNSMIISGPKRVHDEQNLKESNESRHQCLAPEILCKTEERSKNNDINRSVNAIGSGGSSDLS